MKRVIYFLLFGILFCNNAIYSRVPNMGSMAGWYDCMRDDKKYLSPFLGYIYIETDYLKKMYDFDMNIEHKNKLLDDIPEVDIVITMGCNVDCPMLPCTYREDWGLDDPTGGSEFEFNLTAKLIEEKIKNLVLRIEAGEIKL